MARGPRSSLLFGWLVGMLFHQGGTVSTVLAGTTVKPVADRHRVSHEELSYVVDSTASPVATILPFNAWPAYVAALVAGTIPLLPDEAASYRFFLSSIPFNFYALFAVTATLLFSLGLLPWVGGTMARARDAGARDRRAGCTGGEAALLLRRVRGAGGGGLPAEPGRLRRAHRRAARRGDPALHALRHGPDQRGVSALRDGGDAPGGGARHVARRDSRRLRHRMPQHDHRRHRPRPGRDPRRRVAGARNGESGWSRPSAKPCRGSDFRRS